MTIRKFVRSRLSPNHSDSISTVVAERPEDASEILSSYGVVVIKNFLDIGLNTFEINRICSGYLNSEFHSSDTYIV